MARKHRIRDPEWIARQEGIPVHPVEYEEESDLRGCCVCYIKTKLIRYNNRLTDYAKRILLAHELGHAMLHAKGSVAFQCSDYWSNHMRIRQEMEANTFAAELLISDEDFWEEMSYDYTLYQIAQSHSVPAALVYYKVKSLQERGHPELRNIPPPDNSFMGKEWEDE